MELPSTREMAAYVDGERKLGCTDIYYTVEYVHTVGRWRRYSELNEQIASAVCSRLAAPWVFCPSQQQTILGNSWLALSVLYVADVCCLPVSLPCLE